MFYRIISSLTGLLSSFSQFAIATTTNIPSLTGLLFPRFEFKNIILKRGINQHKKKVHAKAAEIIPKERK